MNCLAGQSSASDQAAVVESFSALGDDAKTQAWVNLDFFKGFCSFPLKFNYFTRNEAQEQHSLLDTIFDYIFYFGPPGKHL